MSVDEFEDEEHQFGDHCLCPNYFLSFSNKKI